MKTKADMLREAYRGERAVVVHKVGRQCDACENDYHHDWYGSICICCGAKQFLLRRFKWLGRWRWLSFRCRPLFACARHGRCWPHSEWEKDHGN